MAKISRIKLSMSDMQETPVFNEIGYITSMNGPSGSRDVESVAYVNADAYTKSAGALDAGQISLDVQYDADSAAYHTDLEDHFYDTVDAVDFQLEYISGPESAPIVERTLAFSAIVAGYSVSKPGNSKMTASISLDISGKPTRS
ncbi:hypothetical protein [Magnetococcus sp. PR-3]|uniref:hypothetical protein n=1 Tax=Magnetococcus sp. PR-3 TaxID=3120355 RepID=UPI002FCE138D